MRESLREFIYREAGPDEASRLDLIRHLAPSVLIANGYDFNELRQLIQYGPGWNSSSGSEYVSDAWPKVPVTEPLPCITIRPFNPHGYATTPYELVEALAGHLRDLLVGFETSPDYNGIIRFGFIEPESMARWREAAERWRALRGLVTPSREDAAPREPGPKPAQQQLAQELAILEAIRQTGHDPKRLPTIEADLKEASRNGLDAAPESAAASASWKVNEPERFRGYTFALYRLLMAAHRQGKARPTAREVLEEWRSNKPQEVAMVLTDGIDYYNGNGDSRPASLRAITMAINRLTSAR